MRRIMQILLITWFVALSLFVLIPSFHVLSRAPADLAILPPPQPPEPPASASESNVVLYTQQVAAYQQYVVGYAAYSQMTEKNERESAYEFVVTKTLLPLLEKMFVAFLAYAFVVAAATTIDNVSRLRHNQPPQSIRLF